MAIEARIEDIRISITHERAMDLWCGYTVCNWESFEWYADLAELASPDTWQHNHRTTLLDPKTGKFIVTEI